MDSERDLYLMRLRSQPAGRHEHQAFSTADARWLLLQIALMEDVVDAARDVVGLFADGYPEVFANGAAGKRLIETVKAYYQSVEEEKDAD